MKGRFAIRGCSELELTTKMSGLWSLPDAVVMNCLAQVSRLDLAALAIASKSHRSLVVSPELWNLRCQMGCIEPCLYVLLHIFREPNPRWFILHPLQRRLKPIHSNLNPAPQSGSSFVLIDWGIYVIGGLIKGDPTSDVSFFDCFEHTWRRLPSMKIARCFASASLIEGKIYVFGGCLDVADSSNWAEVFDIMTETWDFLFVVTPKKVLLDIQQSVVIDNKEVYAVDRYGQNFSFSPSKSIFVANGKIDSKRGYITDWCLLGTFLFCGVGCGIIKWCLPYELDWKEVKGLEELCGYDICHLCRNSATKITIFWITQPNDSENLDLWSAEISLSQCEGSEGSEIWGKIEWSCAVLSDSSIFFNFVYAASVYA